VSAPARICPANGSSKEPRIDIQHVPYKGNAPAVNDMLGGHNTLMFDIPSTAVPLVQAGKLKALAVADKKRLPELPDVPTMIEQGFPALKWRLVHAARSRQHAEGRSRSAQHRSQQGAENARSCATSSRRSASSLSAARRRRPMLTSAREMKKWGDVVEKSGLKPQ
jgi:tripartite-type tricarboxylate transporter receptor subunit TctC